jgi:protein tyrosine phosphatase (PTP) superfamily phosphohydrolase (DUF442 family)
MARSFSLAMVIAGMLLGSAGCQTCGRRPPPPNPPAGAQLTPRLPASPAPYAFPTVPSQPPPPSPPAASFLPPTGIGAPPNAPPPGLGPPRVETRWQPTEAQAAPPRVQLAAPEPLPKDDTKYSSPGAADKPRSPEPPLAAPRRPTTLPVGIPQFAEVSDQVATGLRPSLDDGLDWLQAHDYRTVLHLRAPGEVDSADRQQVEKRGLTYLSLEVSPETLTRARADEFVAFVRSPARQPLFVYDRDGSLLGPLWYYLFRTADNLSADAAHQRARTLGLREERAGPYRAMWLAVQALLGENNR